MAWSLAVDRESRSNILINVALSGLWQARGVHGDAVVGRSLASSTRLVDFSKTGHGLEGQKHSLPGTDVISEAKMYEVL